MNYYNLIQYHLPVTNILCTTSQSTWRICVHGLAIHHEGKVRSPIITYVFKYMWLMSDRFATKSEMYFNLTTFYGIPISMYIDMGRWNNSINSIYHISVKGFPDLLNSTLDISYVIKFYFINLQLDIIQEMKATKSITTRQFCCINFIRECSTNNQFLWNSMNTFKTCHVLWAQSWRLTKNLSTFFLNHCMEIIQLSSKTGVAITRLAQVACEKQDSDGLHAYEADRERCLKRFPTERTSVTNWN